MQEELLHQRSEKNRNLIIQKKFPHSVILAQPADVVLHLVAASRIQVSDPKIRSDQVRITVSHTYFAEGPLLVFFTPDSSGAKGDDGEG